MDGVIHLAAAVAIVVGITFTPWLAIPAFFTLGFFWEKTQHKDQGWFGWITLHRAWEALAWGIGGTIAAVAMWYFR